MPPESPTAMRRRLALARFLELAIGHQALEPALDELFRLLLLKSFQRLRQRLLERLHRRLGVAMRAAQRLGHDLVDEAERLQAVRRDAERLGRVRRHLGAAPE